MKTATAKKTITIERTFDGDLEDVWDLWTTKAGLEAWWGPDGFSTKVHKLELWPGGALHYAMTATAPEQVAFMKKAGLPLTSDTHGRYDEIVPRSRLAFRQVADFIPGVAAYDIATVVELQPSAAGVHMLLVVDAMHDEPWTKRAEQGWRSQLDKLGKLLATILATKRATKRASKSQTND
jgi:uncharacterized protein YndB with AHSA1/START domain